MKHILVMLAALIVGATQVDAQTTGGSSAAKVAAGLSRRVAKP